MWMGRPRLQPRGVAHWLSERAKNSIWPGGRFTRTGVHKSQVRVLGGGGLPASCHIVCVSSFCFGCLFFSVGPLRQGLHTFQCSKKKKIKNDSKEIYRKMILDTGPTPRHCCACYSLSKSPQIYSQLVLLFSKYWPKDMQIQNLDIICRAMDQRDNNVRNKIYLDNWGVICSKRSSWSVSLGLEEGRARTGLCKAKAFVGLNTKTCCIGSLISSDEAI